MVVQKENLDVCRGEKQIVFIWTEMIIDESEARRSSKKRNID